MKKRFKFSNMSVRSKLLAFGGIALLFTVIIAIASIQILQTTNKERIRRYVVYADREIVLSDSFTYFNQIRTNTRNLIGIYKDMPDKQQEIIKQMDEEFALIDTKFEIFSEYLDQYSQDIQTGFEELVGCIDKYKDSVDIIISFSNAKNYEAAEDEIENNSMVIVTPVEDDEITNTDFENQSYEVNNTKNTSSSKTSASNKNNNANNYKYDIGQVCRKIEQ